MDNVPEFLYVTLVEWAEKHEIQLEFIKPGKLTQNSYVEEFNRTCYTEVLNMYVFKRLSEVREITDNWIRQYNKEQPHDSLGDLTPIEFLIDNSKTWNTLRVTVPNLGALHNGGLQAVREQIRS